MKLDTVVGEMIKFEERDNNVREEYYNFPPEAIIALRFKQDEVPLDEVRYMFDVLKETFPTHKLIAFPEDIMRLEEMETERLIDFRNYLSQIIDERIKS